MFLFALGIARTCEVFAVEKLCIADTRVLKSEVFQGIAVSSDDWLDIQQVAVSEVIVQLQLWRKQGYTIVGLEQTDASICLSKTELPKKWVLVLGREKEGIPVDVLLEMDYCVEIPQLGVIRSLNVHVSAAIAIWECTKHNAFSK